MWASVENDYTKRGSFLSLYHEEEQVSLSVEDQGGAELNEVFCLPAWTFSSGWILFKTSKQMIQTDTDHRHLRHILLCRHQNWNHQYWSHMIIADESRFSLYQCDNPVFLYNNPLTFQQHDETFGHGHYSSMGWPWTDRQMSDDTISDGPCISGINLEPPPTYLERYPADTKHLWAARTETQRPIRLISPTLIPDTGRNLFPLLMRRRVRSSSDVIEFNRCPRIPWVRLLVSRIRHRTFEMAPCDNLIIRNIFLWESPWSKNGTIFSIIVGRIFDWHD